MLIKITKHILLLTAVFLAISCSSENEIHSYTCGSSIVSVPDSHYVSSSKFWWIDRYEGFDNKTCEFRAVFSEANTPSIKTLSLSRKSYSAVFSEYVPQLEGFDRIENLEKLVTEGGNDVEEMDLIDSSEIRAFKEKASGDVSVFKQVGGKLKYAAYCGYEDEMDYCISLERLNSLQYEIHLPFSYFSNGRYEDLINLINNEVERWAE